MITHWRGQGWRPWHGADAPNWTVVGYDRSIVEMDGVGAIVWFLALHRRASHRTGLIEQSAMLPENCPDCGKARLRHVEGGSATGDERGTVWCNMCSLRWTWDDYMTYTERLIFGGALA
jgi:hypothetical protein